MPPETLPQDTPDPRRKRELANGKPNPKFTLTPEQRKFVVETYPKFRDDYLSATTTR